MRSWTGVTTKSFVVIISAAFFLTFAFAGTETGSVIYASDSPVVYASAEIYAKHCAQCHGMDGRARTAKGKRTGATDFTGTDWNNDNDRAVRIITNGKGDMPSFKKKLSTAQIQSAWNHVRNFRK